MNPIKNHPRILLTLLTLIAFSQVKAIEYGARASRYEMSEGTTYKPDPRPWHQRFTEFVKNKIDDITKTPKTNNPDWINDAFTAHQKHFQQTLVVEKFATREAQAAGDNHRANTINSYSGSRLEIDVAKAHRQSIKIANPEHLARLSTKSLRMILPEIEPDQLADMAKQPNYNQEITTTTGSKETFRYGVSPELAQFLSPEQAKALLEQKDSLKRTHKWSDQDIEALEQKADTRSVFQKMIDTFKAEKSASKQRA